MYLTNGRLFYSRDDQCNDCANKNRCPLIEALIYKMVDIIPEELACKNCGLYENKKLKLIGKEPLNNVRHIGHYIKQPKDQ